MQKCGGRVGNFVDIRTPIFEYKPDSHGAEDYLALCREIIEKG
jgi:cellulose biosynthesis protein BcsQ